MTDERTAPQPRTDARAEVAMLGAVLLDPGVLPRLTPIVQPGDVYDPKLALVLDAYLALSRRHEPIDVVTVCAELLAIDRLNTIGGAQAIGELTDGVFHGACEVRHAEAYARIVADNAAARRAADIFTKALATVRDPSRPCHDAIADALASVRGLTSQRRDRQVVDMAACVDAMLEHIENVAGQQGQCVPTGFPSLDGWHDGREEHDGILGGLHGGQLIVLAAPTGGGKTSWALNVAEHVARSGRRVLLFSQEMPRVELIFRFACGACGVPAVRARKARLSKDELLALHAEGQKLRHLPISVEDSGRATVADIRDQVLRTLDAGDCGLVVVDYLQKLKPVKRDPSEVRQLEEMTGELKSIAQEGRVPVLLLSQYNREGGKKAQAARPSRYDLRGSGSIENDADVILFLHHEPPDTDDEGRPKWPKVSRCTLIVDKHRQGDVGDVEMEFDRPRTRFREVGHPVVRALQEPDAHWSDGREHDDAAQ